MKREIIIGTRSSKLALWQTNHIKDLLKKLDPDIKINIKEIKTKGDNITDVALSKIGGKGLFTKEIEDALLNSEIDLAVHSLKDLPTKLPDSLTIGAVLKRESPHDVLLVREQNNTMSLPGQARESNHDTVSNSVLDSSFSTRDRSAFGWRGNDKSTFASLPSKSKIGTSSLRRVAQLRTLRNDLTYLDLRGNLDTRIKKLEDGQYYGIVLAYAGIKRLGFEEKISEHFNIEEIVPAVGQGALAIEIRESDIETRKLVTLLNDNETYMASIIERDFLSTLQGGCQVPIGAYTKFETDKITLIGIVTSLDGRKIVREKMTVNRNSNDYKNLGLNLAQKLLQLGGKEILAELLNNKVI